MVKKTFFGGALILIRMDGEKLPLPVNSDAVKNSMHDRGCKIRISTLFSSFLYFVDKKIYHLGFHKCIVKVSH